MKINEYFKGKDIWGKIKTKGSFEFIDSTYETLFLIKYGQRSLFSSFKSLDDEAVSDLIVNTFKHKWDTLLEVDIKNFLAGDTVVNSTEQITDNSWTDEASNTNQVSAFNDADLVTDDKQVQDSNRNLVGSVLTTYTTDTIKLSDALVNLGIMESLEVKHVAMDDVIDLIALSIYK